MMISGFSDTAGRRPAYLICFTIYLAANLGLSLQNNYAALMVLRCLQSAGSSGTVALANGVVGDLVPSAERGQYIAFASLGSILGPTVSPILGGLLSTYLGWHWIFWFLLIFSGAFVVPFFLFLPETCRNVVDDGQIPPPLLNWSLTDFIRHRRREKAGQTFDTAKRDQLRRNNRLSFPNPLSSLVVFKDRETIMILIATGLTFGSTFTVSTGASALFTTTYHYDDIQVALLFIPLGAGSLLSAFTTGRLVDLNFRKHAIRLNFPLVRNRKQDISNFPIERARLEIAIPMIYLSAAGLVVYGWILDRQVSIAGPVVMLFVIGYALTGAFQVLNVLMVDIYPGKPAAVTAANNLVRCEIGAGAAAIISPLIRAVGDGWAYTIVALITLAGTLCLIFTMIYGMRWRQSAITKKEKREGPKNGDEIRSNI